LNKSYNSFFHPKNTVFISWGSAKMQLQLQSFHKYREFEDH